MTNETTEGELTPTMLKAMKSFSAGERSTYRHLTIGAGIFTLMMGMGILLHLLKQPFVFFMFGGIGALFFLAFLAGAIWGNMASTKALRSTKYKHVSGPMRAESYEASMIDGSATYKKYRLVLGGSQFPLEADIAKKLEKVTLGTAEYAPYTFGRIVLFQVVDADGQSVYRLPNYDPA